MSKEVWEERAKRFLKAELKRQGVTYEDLAHRLSALGISETEGSVGMKISRGTYPAWFLFAVMSVIGISVLRLENE
jgi:hypothetical protein